MSPIAEKTPAYGENMAEPKCRAELIKYWMNINFDKRTANRKLWVSEGGAKVARLTDDITCPVLEGPERFEYMPQVLCKEGVEGFRAYWEVECLGWVVVGLAYQNAGRRNEQGCCGLGDNEDSWGLGWSGTSYHAWHEGQVRAIPEISKSSVLGVYIDQPAGILNFYAVEKKEDREEEVKLLQRIKSCFREKMLPGVWLGVNSHCVVRKREE
ncbi:tripartite motif-containing protein 16-like [Entelurus aequoreus]|uniref:tripartite motif-containing protein 16-like n=1 Tax=Entelurus aequoreus TaxID=161455 RepID=UPI002B1E8F29|nr:tripartite motif-containing protein 16-like [Entelurus aequoreus]